GGGPAPRHRKRPHAAASRDAMLDALPDAGAVIGRAVRYRQRIDHVEDALQPAIGGPALATLFQVAFHGEGFALFAVVVQDQLFYAEMIHRDTLTRGSRARLSFCTARKTLCLAAPGWHSRIWLTSSIHMPSK